LRFWCLGDLSEFCLVFAYILAQRPDDPLHVSWAYDDPGRHDPLGRDDIDEVDKKFLLAVRNNHIVGVDTSQDLVRNLDPQFLGFFSSDMAALLVIIYTASDWIR
jgi:hypothetical protein